MTYKQILVREDLHNRVKARAALLGQSIREYAESLFLDDLADSPLNQTAPDNGRRLLVDPNCEYRAE